jgi:hypothetical protein
MKKTITTILLTHSLVLSGHAQFGGIDEFNNQVIDTAGNLVDPSLWVDAPSPPLEDLSSANANFVEGGVGFEQLYFESAYVGPGVQVDFDYLQWQQLPSVDEDWYVYVDVVNTFESVASFFTETARIGIEIYPSDDSEPLDVLSFYSQAFSSTGAGQAYTPAYQIFALAGQYVGGVIQDPDDNTQATPNVFASPLTAESLPLFQHRLYVSYRADVQTLTLAIDFNSADADPTLITIGSIALDGIGGEGQTYVVDWDLAPGETFDIFLFGGSVDTSVNSLNGDLVYAERFVASLVDKTTQFSLDQGSVDISLAETAPGFFYQAQKSTDLSQANGGFGDLGTGIAGDGNPISATDNDGDPSAFYRFDMQ